MKNVVRKLKLSKLTSVNYLSDKESDIVNFVNSKIRNLSEFRMNVLTELVYYINQGDERILKYNKHTNHLECKLDGFWKVLKDDFMLDTEDIKDIIGYLVYITYNINAKYVGWVYME